MRLITIFSQFLIPLSAKAPLTPQTYQRGVQAFPCQQVIPTGQQLSLDFGQLCKYEDANQKLHLPSDHRVIFFGDSLTELWGSRIPGLQKNDDVINRGISGQTTAQMLVRFRADVINLKPHIVHLMMGTNDIAGNTGATSIARIQDAIASMAEQAQANGIRVVLAAIPPAKILGWSPGVDPVPSIREINKWIQRYANQKGFTFVDYGPALTDGADGISPNLSADGVHPNAAGYLAMIPIAADAIQRANE